MSQILVTQSRLDRTSGITADAVVNTFHHSIDGDLPADAVTGAVAIHLELAGFYNTVGAYLSSLMAGTITHKTYSLSDPIPRAPVHTSTSTFTPGATTPLPAEVAMCGSYRSVQPSGVPASRTRGRIYIGPLASSTLGVVTAGDIRPAAAFATALRNALSALATEAAGAPTFGVWSPTSLTFRPVVEVSTDDAFDSQRRRGARATVRTRLVVP